MNEADTCRKYVVPVLRAAGWDNDHYSSAEQRWFTKSHTVVRANWAEWRQPKRADYPGDIGGRHVGGRPLRHKCSLWAWISDVQEGGTCSRREFNKRVEAPRFSALALN